MQPLLFKQAAHRMVSIVRRKRAVWWPSEAEPRFHCPLCDFVGPFVPAGGRPNAQCPACRGYERHRLQTRVLEQIAGRLPAGARCLQFAPDPMTRQLRRFCAEVITADLQPGRAMLALNVCAIDMPDASFDMVYASHVLEHVLDDATALREIARVLRPGGLAVLPVPMVGERTREYGVARPEEHGHVRATGWDYFDRYRAVFPEVTLFRSEDIPGHERDQLWVYGDWGAPPTSRHADAVPVCRKG